MATSFALSLGCSGGGGGGGGGPPPAPPSQNADFSVLVFSETAGFRHGSIAAGVAAVQDLGARNNFAVVTSEDSSVFQDTVLANYAAVIFLNTTGDILTDPEQDALVRYIQAGGGFVGVHSASDTEKGWPWYGDLVGAFFSDHPAIQTASIDLVDGSQASTNFLPSRFDFQDEWYNFTTDPSGQVQVLLNLDETTYNGGTMGASHPIAWFQFFDGGRSWYTNLGHRSETYQDPRFLGHLLGGIRFAAGFD